MTSSELAAALDRVTERGEARWLRDPDTGAIFCVTPDDLIAIECVDAEPAECAAIELTIRNVKRLFVAESADWKLLIKHVRSAENDLNATYEAKRTTFAAFANTLRADDH